MNIPVQTKCPACQSEKIQSLFTVPDHEYNVDYRALYSQCLDCFSFLNCPCRIPPDFPTFIQRTTIALTATKRWAT